MVSSTVLTLVVIPAIYALVKGRGLPPADQVARVAADGNVRLPEAAE